MGIFNRTTVKFAAFGALLTLLVGAVLSFQLIPDQIQPEVGGVAERALKSPSRLTFISDIQTVLRRDQAAQSVSDVTVFDEAIARQQVELLDRLASDVSAILSASSLTRPELIDRIQQTRPVLPELTAAAIADLSALEWTATVGDVRRVLALALSERITAEELGSAQSGAQRDLGQGMSPSQLAVAREMIAALIAPTMFVDEVETTRLRDAAVQAVEPVRVTLEQGEIIVRDGEVITPLSLEKIEAAGLINQEVDWLQAVGLFLMAAMGSVVLTIYVRLFNPFLLDHPRRSLLLIGIIAATMLAAKLTIPGRDAWAIVFPFAAAPMLVATLLGTRLAVMVAALLAVWVTTATRGSLTWPDLNLTFIYLIAGTTGVFTVWRAERLYRFFLAGAGVAAVMAASILAFYLIDPSYPIEQLGVFVIVAVVSGALSAVLTIGVFVLLGTVFGIATSWHLMELAQPNQPLLRRLLTEAPGTYHHSMIVANLAETAAEAIAADVLLVRVGAYYHDIGKMLRPGYFVENQSDGITPHDDLDPEVSAQIIKAHVTDGLELAKQHGLPPKVQDFIPQHHGCRLTMYFYAIATKIDPDAPTEVFRYQGPKPQSRETGIVMLADATEATVRSSDDHSLETILAIIEDVVSQRLTEGELDDSDLTLGDLKQIKASFLSVLRGVYHPRIAYPEPESGDEPAAEERSAPASIPEREAVETTR